MERATYLNNAAEGWPKAPGVVETVCRTMESFPEAEGRSAGAAEDVVEAARSGVAQWLGAEPSSIVFAGSATVALNVAIGGLPPECFRHVVITVTEHNSVLRPLHHAVARQGGRLTVVGLNSEGTLDWAAWRGALAQRPTLAAINHVSNVTGQINPIEELLAAAREVGATTLLDASQSVGYLELRPRQWGVDLLAFGGQKGLHGPAGIGVLYVGPGVELQPLYRGGTGVHSELVRQPDRMPMRLEAGTSNAPALAGLLAALHWRRESGTDFASHARRMAASLEQGLRGMARVRLLGAHGPRLGVLSFLLEGWEPTEAAWVLRHSFGIVCRAGLHCAPELHRALGSGEHGAVRFSVSGFTTEQEVDRALAAVRQMTQ